MARPRLVLVHGACHQPWVWGPLVQQLEGWEVELVDLPSSTPGVMGDLAADTAAVREALTRDERPVAVVAHSYGGTPVGEAVGGLANVVRAFHLATVMLPPGGSVPDAAGGYPPYWDVDEDSGTFGAADPETRRPSTATWSRACAGRRSGTCAGSPPPASRAGPPPPRTRCSRR